MEWELDLCDLGQDFAVIFTSLDGTPQSSTWHKLHSIDVRQRGGVLEQTNSNGKPNEWREHEQQYTWDNLLENDEFTQEIQVLRFNFKTDNRHSLEVYVRRMFRENRYSIPLAYRMTKANANWNWCNGYWYPQTGYPNPPIKLSIKALPMDDKKRVKHDNDE